MGVLFNWCIVMCAGDESGEVVLWAFLSLGGAKNTAKSARRWGVKKKHVQVSLLIPPSVSSLNVV